jgi:hypothetical protein
MRFAPIGVLAVAGFLLLSPSAAEAACCGQDHKDHSTTSACCDRRVAEPDGIEFVWSMDPQLMGEPPARQSAEVWFHRPLFVGKAILQGRYVIEHDNDRQARGEPCTHIYAYNNRTKPVAAFHCTHLERPRAGQNTVGLATGPDGVMKVLTEFQFAGETAAHGYPSVR